MSLSTLTGPACAQASWRSAPAVGALGGKQRHGQPARARTLCTARAPLPSPTAMVLCSGQNVTDARCSTCDSGPAWHFICLPAYVLLLHACSCPNKCVISTRAPDRGDSVRQGSQLGQFNLTRLSQAQGKQSWTTQERAKWGGGWPVQLVQRCLGRRPASSVPRTRQRLMSLAPDAPRCTQCCAAAHGQCRCHAMRQCLSRGRASLIERTPRCARCPA